MDFNHIIHFFYYPGLWPPLLHRREFLPFVCFFGGGLHAVHQGGDEGLDLFVHLLEVDETFGVPFFIFGVEPPFDRSGGCGFFVEISDGITVAAVAALEFEIIIDHVFCQFGTILLVGVDADRGTEINDMVSSIVVFDDLSGVFIECLGPF